MLSSIPIVTISIVSHGHGSMVLDLLADIERSCKDIQVILTLNIPEPESFTLPAYLFPLELIQNSYPKGFGANHNVAFSKVTTPLFLVLNPDIRIPNRLDFDEMQTLLTNFKADVLGVKVVNCNRDLQDSARFFPSPITIAKRIFSRNKKSLAIDYDVKFEVQTVDWIAGMFMLFSYDGYRRLGGFNEKYFLYFEDVEICQRIKSSGRQIIWFTNQWIEHNAQKDSRRKIKYTLLHIKSALRYFLQKNYLMGT